MHPAEHAINDGRALITQARRIAILTGAGVSKESGIPTFRDAGGLWRTYSPQELANPDAFARDPALVWAWYDMRRQKMAPCDPNPAHLAIARCQLFNASQGKEGKAIHVITQNVDGLHALALNRVQGFPDDAPLDPALAPLELHGNIYRIRCTGCGARRVDRGPIDSSSVAALPHCRLCGALERPDIVWFGEMLPEGPLQGSIAASSDADLALVVGTSGLVQPAASLPLLTRQRGGHIIEVNPQATPLSREATVVIPMAAGAAVPKLLKASD